MKKEWSFDRQEIKYGQEKKGFLTAGGLLFDNQKNFQKYLKNSVCLMFHPSWESQELSQSKIIINDFD